MKTASALLGVAGLLLAGTAHAANPITGTMCNKFHGAQAPSGCGTSDGVEANNFDHPVEVWVSDAHDHKLLVFLHGHNGAPDTGLEFQKLANELGFDVISLDYAYGRDYCVTPTWSPADANCPEPSPPPKGLTCAPAHDRACLMSQAQVCGCYSDCYEKRWTSIWQGGGGSGLPTVTQDWSINARLLAVINWMNSHGHPRFGSYLAKGTGGDGIKWSVLTLAAHSLGTSLAGVIAKSKRVDRVVMMSGTGDTMAPHTDSNLSTWSSAYGCNSCEGIDANGHHVTFTNCKCHDTTFAFGVNGAGKPGVCTLSLETVGWAKDGHPWQTLPDRFFGFEDSDDATNNWFGPGHISAITQNNWTAIGLGPPWSFTTGAGSHSAVNLSGAHGVVVESTPHPAPAQICDVGSVSGHDATISDGACSTSGAHDDAERRRSIWRFILTH